MEAIRVEQLNFTYPGQTRPALREVDLAVERGEFFVLCGNSGSGKSTLLRHLKPALTPHGEKCGTVSFFGTPIAALDERTAAAKIGFVLQSPEHSAVTDKVWHELAFGLESLGTDPSVIRRRTAEMAAFFGIEHWYDKDVATLSGGQKQLLALASVMVMQPEVLILDEPTAQLDPIAASEFLQTLGRINRELGTTVILSEHRLEEVFSMADRVAVMEAGTVCYTGTAKAVGQYLKRDKSALFQAMPAAMRIWGSVESEEDCPVTVNEGRAFLSDYLQSHRVKPVPVRPTPTVGEERVRVAEAWFRYEADTPDVVKGLSFTAHAGELVCILGGNGAGKTTALKLIAGRKKPYRGAVCVTGTVGLLPQDPQTVFLKKTVYEDLDDALQGQKRDGKTREEAIARVAELCHLGELLTRHPYDLSGGEQQRAALAKILLLHPDVLLLDEPTKGLDVCFKAELAAILRKLCRRGVCVIMVSHDIEFCAKYADRCGLFFDGQLVTADPPAEFFSGNSFYTTAAGRMAREWIPGAVTAEDVIAALGGEIPAEPAVAEGVPADFTVPAVTEREKHPLPRWRKIAAGLSALAALAVLLFATGDKTLNQYLDSGGVTAMGWRQIGIYAVFILLLVLVAVFLGRRNERPGPVPLKKEPLSRRTKAALVSLLLLIPLTALGGMVYLDNKQYYVTSLAILLESMLPFFLVFEGRRPKARELVIIAVLCAVSVAGRAVLFMLPQFKPVTAMAIIAGVAFGGETGFLVGSVSMLVSNILFSQGPWTPWQMFAMGIIGFLAGVRYRRGLLRPSRGSLCVFGALCTFLVFGGIMNASSALVWNRESINLKILASYYITGFPMDVVHAAATALFLWFGAEPMLEKLERVKVKYGMIE